MRWIAVTALCLVALFAAIVSPCEASSQLRGRIVDVHAPATVIVAHEATPDMPAMRMPFLVTPRILKKLQRGMEITAGVDRRTSPQTYSVSASLERPWNLQQFVTCPNYNEATPCRISLSSTNAATHYRYRVSADKCSCSRLFIRGVATLRCVRSSARSMGACNE